MVQELHEQEESQDITKNWVNSSVYLFYLKLFVIFALVLGGCFNLFQHRYKGKPDVAVPENTLYTPKYK